MVTISGFRQDLSVALRNKRDQFKFGANEVGNSKLYIYNYLFFI